MYADEMHFLVFEAGGRCFHDPEGEIAIPCEWTPNSDGSFNMNAGGFPYRVRVVGEGSVLELSNNDRSVQLLRADDTQTP